MTRFKKEMIKKFPHAFREDITGEKSAFCIDSESLIVFSSPCLVTVLHVLQNGKMKEVTDDYPQYSAPYLVHLCGGDLEKAKEILKNNRF